MLEVRPVVESDVEDILGLVRGKAAFDGCAELFQSQEQEILEAFFGERPKARAIIALKDKKAVGIATYYRIYSTFIAKPGIWLDDLFVYENARKYGVGKALMSELCKIARSEGCGRIDWIVARDNENGRGFYESLGASIFEEVRHSRLDEAAINRVAEASEEHGPQ